jgi:hypothetical protein
MALLGKLNRRNTDFDVEIIGVLAARLLSFVRRKAAEIQMTNERQDRHSAP